MNLQEFKASLKNQLPEEHFSPALRALWYDAKGDWREAHKWVQDDPSDSSSWVHAYLHRKEGDIGNASYWYQRANKSLYKGLLEDEWELITKSLLRR